jgi:hypothetical protein
MSIEGVRVERRRAFAGGLDRDEIARFPRERWSVERIEHGLSAIENDAMRPSCCRSSGTFHARVDDGSASRS